jgi:hypothetical protein
MAKTWIKQIALRVIRDEYDAIKKYSDTQGLSMNEAIRRVLMKEINIPKGEIMLGQNVCYVCDLEENKGEHYMAKVVKEGADEHCDLIVFKPCPDNTMLIDFKKKDVKHCEHKTPGTYHNVP